MKIIFYCVGKDVVSGEKNRIILHEDTVIFFICSQCVFTTAARRVDNKFILNTKGKWCEQLRISFSKSTLLFCECSHSWQRQAKHA